MNRLLFGIIPESEKEVRPLLLEASAKINWTLDITGVREDGYHLMDMLMQPVSLADDIRLERSEDLILETSGFPKVRADDTNLALRAARVLKDASGYPSGARISVFKRIPVGAGLGGGSADAAAVLAGLNRLWHTGLSQEKLEQLGLSLGADVPFCLRGGLARVTGIGESIRSYPCSRFYWLVLVQPCKGLSTGEVFTAWAESENVFRPDNDRALEGILSGSPETFAPVLGNVLQSVSVSMRPEIGEALECLNRSGAVSALMTGSGSAVFGVFSSAASARLAEAKCREKWRSVFMCHTRNESVLFSGSPESSGKED